MTLPADHHWRCDCGGGHFLTIVWDPDEKRSMMADIEGYLSIEGDNDTLWRHRIAQAWRVLTSGCSPTRVGVILDATKAREIAATLSDFADDAAAAPPARPKRKLSDLRTAAEIHEQDMQQDPEYRREWKRTNWRPLAGAYDPEADALYIRVTNEKTASTKEIDASFLVDLDAANAIVGIEVIHPLAIAVTGHGSEDAP